MKKWLKCWLLGNHNWTCKAEQGIQPTEENFASLTGFFEYAKSYCADCGKVNPCSQRAVNEAKIKDTSYFRNPNA